MARYMSVTPQEWKDVVVDLPPGIAANPQVAPKCPFTQLLSGYILALNEPDLSNCPAASQVATMDLETHGGFLRSTTGVKVYNMVPEGDEPAEFAFTVASCPAWHISDCRGQRCAMLISGRRPRVFLPVVYPARGDHLEILR